MTLLFPEWGFVEAFGKPRHPQWDELRDSVIEECRTCQCCARRSNLQVHHLRPYHLFPELELEKSNLIVLCAGGPLNCHYLAGHGGAGWHRYCEDVKGSIRRIREMFSFLRVSAIEQ